MLWLIIIILAGSLSISIFISSKRDKNLIDFIEWAENFFKNQPENFTAIKAAIKKHFNTSIDGD